MHYIYGVQDRAGPKGLQAKWSTTANKISKVIFLTTIFETRAKIMYNKPSL